MISTHSIVADYFNYCLRNQTDSNNPLLPYVIKMASECEIKFRFNFSSASSIINAENIHREIARELFNNNNITWTYVINFISFSAMLAENIIHKQPQNEDSIIGLFIDRTVDLIDSNLHLWFEQHHHWVVSFKFSKNHLL